MILQTQDPYRDMLCNPYAPDFLLGVGRAGDPETPEGMTDLYTEFVYNPSQPLVSGLNLIDIFQFDEDFIIRELKGGGDFLVRFRDIDGTYTSDAPVATALMLGPGPFPKPQVPDWFVPQGRFITIEITVP